MKKPVELIKPEGIRTHKDSQFPYYGKFIIEPLERGFGQTLGNAFRRILLSSIPGYSITEVRIVGAPHEFTSLPGVIEDVTDIILNLKGVRFKLEGEGPFNFSLKKSGPAEVKAGDIQVPAEIGQVVNPEHYIATLSGDGQIEMELKVEKGRGYAPVEYTRNNEVGVILVDGLFLLLQELIILSVLLVLVRVVITIVLFLKSGQMEPLTPSQLFYRLREFWLSN